ncbi:hypothetical protein CBS101457_001402 [Exobasidium rhododendri]|nr:hypothetical protein CBS101457_001402 [Exobasidium rhododendri]
MTASKVGPPPSELPHIVDSGIIDEGDLADQQHSSASHDADDDRSRANSEEYDMSNYGSSEDEGKAPKLKAGFTNLFRFASKWDLIFNFAGILAACAAGTAQPLMTLIFGDLTTIFLRYSNKVSERSLQELLQSNVSEFMITGGMIDATSATIAELRSQAEQELRHGVKHFSLHFFYIGIAIFGSTYIYMSTWVYTGEEITRRIREAYLSAVLRQEIAYFDMVGPDEITTLIQNDIQLIQDGISDKVPMSMMFIATFVAGFAVAYAKSWELSLAMSSILPCIVGAGAAMNVFITKYQQIELQHVAQAANIAEESLSGVRTVKAFAIEQKLVDLYDECNARTTKQGRKKAVIQGAGLGIFFFIIYASYSLAFYFGSKLLARGNIESGTVMTVIFSIFIGAFSLAMLAPNFTALSYALSAAGKVFETIDRVSEIDSFDSKGLRPTECRGDIEFRDVNFRYPTRRHHAVLRSFSMAVAGNSMTAIVGASGTGKSTIVSLLERFYDPDQGQILVDGVDIKDLNLTWLRQHIGLVSQETVLFSATIRENIEYGLTHAQRESSNKAERIELVVNAAKQARAHDFITALLPDGYETLIGEGDCILSDGQKQQIALARAVVSRPPIVVLDEATFALDSLSDETVQGIIDDIAKDRTTIIVAHRLSTIKKADKIVVLGRGRVLEQGRHDELVLRTDGPYSAILKAQQIQVNEAKQKAFFFAEEKKRSMAAEKKDGQDTHTAAERGNLSAARASSDYEKTSTLICQSSKSSVAEKGVPHKSRGIFYLLYRLALINKDHIWTLYIPGIIGSIASGAVYPAFSILFGRALEAYAICQEEYAQACPQPRRHEMRHQSNLSSLYFFIISILATIAIGVQNGNMILASSILMERLRSLSLKALLRSDVDHFDKEGNSSEVLTAHLAENSQRINGLVGVTLATIIQSVSTLVIGWIIAIAYSWRFALPMIATSPLTLSAGLFRLILVVLKDQKIKKAHEKASLCACEAAASIRTVAALTREEESVQLYKERLKIPAKITFRTAMYGNVIYAISQALALPTISLGFWYGSHLLLNGQLQVGAFFTVLTATIFASLQAGNAFSFVTDISQAQEAANDSIRLLDNVPLIDSQSNEGIILKHCQGKITFEDVHFSYPGTTVNEKKNDPALRGVSLQIEAGSFCALVGSSGSGRSTVLQLILRFYDCQRGRILIDDHDIVTLHIKHLRKHIALISEEPVLFQGTIGWNIALGAVGLQEDDEDQDHETVDIIERVTEQQIRKAARMANILTFIESLPDGFETRIGGENLIDGSGITQLSNGQKKRITIARAVIRDPKILLIDRPTFEFDVESEEIVQEALKKASRGRTTIVITSIRTTSNSSYHGSKNDEDDLTGNNSASKADQIICLKDGIVFEQGDHQTLMAARGLYSELVNLQDPHKVEAKEEEGGEEEEEKEGEEEGR